MEKGKGISISSEEDGGGGWLSGGRGRVGAKCTASQEKGEEKGSRISHFSRARVLGGGAVGVGKWERGNMLVALWGGKNGKGSSMFDPYTFLFASLMGEEEEALDALKVRGGEGSYREAQMIA